VRLLQHSAGIVQAALAVALLAVASLTAVVSANDPVRADDGGDDYASPLEVELSRDGALLYVLCQQSNEVRVLNAANFAVIKKIAVGRVPRGFSLSPDGARLFVANSWDIRSP